MNSPIMTKIKRLFAIAMLGFGLAACQQGFAGMGPKQSGGALVGAGLGALAGSQIGRGRGQLAAVAIGTIAGAMLGSEVGRSLDNADRAYLMSATARAGAAPIGRQVGWRNPDSGHRGIVTPMREGTHRGTGDYCREFRQSVTIDGWTEEAFGTACRQPDGSWKML